MKKFFKDLVLNPFYLPFLVAFMALGYLLWTKANADFLWEGGTLISGISATLVIFATIIYIPFALVFCGAERIFGRGSMSYVVDCGDLTGPSMALLFVLILIEYTLLFLLVRVIVRAVRESFA